jgi:hypothetical protein
VTISAGQPITSADGLRLKGLAAQMTATQNLTSNSSTLQSITEMTIAVANGSHYVGRAAIFYFAGATADLKLAWNFPGGTLTYVADGQDTTAAWIRQSSTAEVSDTTRSWGGSGLAALRSVTYDLTYWCTANGSLTLRAAQVTPTVEVEQIAIYSFMNMKEINW